MERAEVLLRPCSKEGRMTEGQRGETIKVLMLEHGNMLLNRKEQSAR